MPDIYSKADAVAVWLGPESDGSSKAVDFLRRLTDQAQYPKQVSRLLASGMSNGEHAGVVSLFSRDYWRRLWVVQELLKAKKVTVYCGSTEFPWPSYQLASNLFSEHRHELAFQSIRMNRNRSSVSPDQFSYDQVLIYQGPASLPDLRIHMGNREGGFLEILCACRRKLASDPRAKYAAFLESCTKRCGMNFLPITISPSRIYTHKWSTSSSRLRSGWMSSVRQYIFLFIPALPIYLHSSQTGHMPLRQRQWAISISSQQQVPRRPAAVHSSISA